MPVYGVGNKAWMAANECVLGVETIGYDAQPQAASGVHPWVAGFENAVRRGQKVIATLASYKHKGLEPDVIITHPGWGDAFFVRDYFPGARVIGLFEYFYRPRGADVGFDPEFPTKVDDIFRLHVSNATQLLALESCDSGVCPTEWQKSRFPTAYAQQLNVIHEGIDTQRVAPEPQATITLPNGQQLRQGDEVLTFVSRSLEPYRGFHTFMRALPDILKKRPDCQVIIVGAEGVSYGPQPAPPYTSWKEKYLQEVGSDLDVSRVHFLGSLHYSDYLRVLQVSRLHVYLTYPFILSWSMLEAMACGCLLLAADTEPVREVIEDEVNGFLFPFHSPDTLAAMATDLLETFQSHPSVTANARQTIVERFDFATVSLPAYRQLIYR